MSEKSIGGLTASLAKLASQIQDPNIKQQYVNTYPELALRVMETVIGKPLVSEGTRGTFLNLSRLILTMNGGESEETVREMVMEAIDDSSKVVHLLAGQAIKGVEGVRELVVEFNEVSLNIFGYFDQTFNGVPYNTQVKTLAMQVLMDDYDAYVTEELSEDTEESEGAISEEKVTDALSTLQAYVTQEFEGEDAKQLFDEVVDLGITILDYDDETAAKVTERMDDLYSIGTLIDTIKKQFPNAKVEVATV